MIATISTPGTPDAAPSTPPQLLLPSFVNAAGPFEDNVDFDADLRLILKKLAKKDDVTRTKATDELLAYIQSASKDLLVLFLKAWPSVFNRLATDTIRKIRETTFSCHLVLVRQLRKEMAPILKDIMGVWLCAQFDTSAEASRIASESLKVAFPNKLSEALKFCHLEVLIYASDNIFVQTPETLSDARYVNPEDMQAKYGRIVSSSICALGFLFEHLGDNAVEPRNTISELFKRKELWGLLASDHSVIRRSLYQLISDLCQVESSPLASVLSLMRSRFLEKCFQDKDAAIQPEVWNAVLLFTKKFPDCWSAEPSKLIKNVLRYVKSGAHGAVRTAFPALLPLLSVLPLEDLLKSDPDFLRNFLESIWESLASDVVDRAAATVIVSTFAECFIFALPRMSNSLNEIDSCARPILAFLFPKAIKNSFGKLSGAPFLPILTKFLENLRTKPSIPAEFVDELVKRLKEHVSTAVERRVTPSSTKLAGEEAEVFAGNLREIIFSLAQTSNLKPLSEELLLVAFSAATENGKGDLSELPDLMKILCQLSTCGQQIGAINHVVAMLSPFLETNFSILSKAGRDEQLLELSLICIQTPEVGGEKVDNLWHMVSRFSCDVGIVPSLFTKLKSMTPLILSPDERMERFVITTLKARPPPKEILADALFLGQTCQILSRRTMDTICSQLADRLTKVEDFPSLLAAVDTWSEVISQNGPLIWSLPKETISLVVFQAGTLFASSGVFEDAVVKNVERLWFSLMSAASSEEAVPCVLGSLEKWSSAVIRDSDQKPSELIAVGLTLIQLPAASKLDFLFSKLAGSIADLSAIRPSGSADEALSVTGVLSFASFVDNDEEDTSPSPVDLDEFGFTKYSRALCIFASVFNESAPDMVDIDVGTRLIYELLILRTLWADQRATGTVTVFSPIFEQAEFERLAIEPAESLCLSFIRELTRASDKDNFHAEVVDSIDEWLADMSEPAKAGNSCQDVTLLFFQWAARGKSVEARAFGLFFDDVRRNLPVEDADIDLWHELISSLPENDLHNLFASLLERFTFRPRISDPFCTLLKETMRTLIQSDRNTFSHESSIDFSILNALLGYFKFCKLPSLKEIDGDGSLRQLLMKVRGWLESKDGTTAKWVADRKLANGLIFVINLIDLKFEFNVNLSTFVIDLARKGVESRSTISLFYGVSLWRAVLDLSTSEPAVWSGTYKYETPIQRKIVSIFVDFAQPPRDNRAVAVPLIHQEVFRVLLDNCDGVSSETLDDIRCYDKLCRLLDSRDVYVQTRSYQMLAGLTALNVQRNSVQIEMDSSASFLMSSALMESLEKDFGDFDFDEYRHQDCVRALGYILSWLVAADHLKDATYQLKSDYTNQIREHKSVFDNVLLFIFHVLGVGYQDVTPFDLSKWDVTEFHIEALDISERNGFSLLCGHLYWRLLQTFPGLSRSWWSNSKNRQLTKAVETYTERYFSPLLAKWETQAVTVADLSAFDEMAVKVPKTASEIAASYQIDEAKLEITLRFPSAYPLRQIDVDSPTGGRVAGVQESQWRAWMLSTGIIAQNASILDALKVWHKNIKLHFEGLEECAICYSVVGVIDRSLPNKSCKTCKNKFHASCLFKWIRTSGNTQCPLCRTEM